MKRYELLKKLHYFIPLIGAIGLFVACLMMEIFNVEISKEIRDQIYSIFGTAVLICSILLNTVYGMYYGLSWKKAFVFCLLSFFLLFNYTSVVWAKLDVLIFGSGAVASFRSIIFLPLLCWLLTRFCKLDTLNLCDFLTPYFFYDHGVVTIACWIEGCCAGRAWSWGLQNPLNSMTVFPVQPCIIVLSVAVAYWGLYYSKKHNYQANGMVFAGSMCIYGFFRYLIELFTDDSRVFWVMSWLSVCSLVMLALGLFVRYMIGKRMETR